MKKLFMKMTAVLTVLGFLSCSSTDKDPSKIIMIVKPSNNDASFLIISSRGTKLLTDPVGITAGINPDITTVTHKDPDHYNISYLDKLPGRKSICRIESFSEKGISVSGFGSVHNGNDVPAIPTHISYVYEMDGLRIAHLGDIGEDHLSDSQLKTLGKIDILITILENYFSGVTLTNGKALRLIDQIKPQIVIPTHTTPEANKKLSDKLGGYEEMTNSFSISKNDLNNEKRKVIVLKYIP